MLQVISGLSAFGIGIMGNSLADSMRSDIQSMYANFLKDISSFAKDGIDLMIEYNWLEKPPTAPDRKKLTK